VELAGRPGPKERRQLAVLCGLPQAQQRNHTGRLPSPSDEPPLYQVGDWVWMVNYRRRRGQATKLQPKFVGPYVVVEAMPNHTYKLERSGQVSVQNEARLKPYWASPGAAGATPPPLLKPRRQTTMRGRRRHGPTD